MASEIVKQLLVKGYNVHGTVRSLSNEAKVKHLKAFANAFSGAYAYGQVPSSLPGWQMPRQAGILCMLLNVPQHLGVQASKPLLSQAAQFTLAMFHPARAPQACPGTDRVLIHKGATIVRQPTDLQASWTFTRPTC